MLARAFIISLISDFRNAINDVSISRLRYNERKAADRLINLTNYTHIHTNFPPDLYTHIM